MKVETAQLLQNYINDNRLHFADVDNKLELHHDLTDEEKSHLVHIEYGTSLTSSVDELFITIIKKVIQLAIETAKAQYKDKLSEL